MAYVITQACVGHREADCAAVCPVSCIHPTPDEAGYEAVAHLHINPAECTDCDACVEECPWGAIYPEDELPPELAVFASRNAAHYGAG